MIVSLEFLYHYRCDHCQKWWTIGDIKPEIKQQLFCPHCGEKNVVEGIESHIVENDQVNIKKPAT